MTCYDWYIVIMVSIVDSDKNDITLIITGHVIGCEKNCVLEITLF